jgi:hypothetical protein
LVSNCARRDSERLRNGAKKDSRWSLCSGFRLIKKCPQIILSGAIVRVLIGQRIVSSGRILICSSANIVGKDSNWSI